MDPTVLIKFSLFALNINSMNIADPYFARLFLSLLRKYFLMNFLFWQNLGQLFWVSTVNITLKAFEGLM